MVQRVRIRGHVIRLFGMTPSTSRSRPEICPSCGTFYNDGKNRKSIFLCCGYLDCLDCVLLKTTFFCPNLIQPISKGNSKIEDTEEILPKIWISSNWKIDDDEEEEEDIEYEDQEMQAQEVLREENMEDDEISVFTKTENLEISEEHYMEIVTNCENLVEPIKEEDLIGMPKLKPEVNIEPTDFPDDVSNGSGSSAGTIRKLEKFLDYSILVKAKLEESIPKHQQNPVVFLDRVKLEGFKSSSKGNKNGAVGGQVRRSCRVRKNAEIFVLVP